MTHSGGHRTRQVRRRWAAVGVVGALSLVARPIHAQEVGASLGGTVVDETGAALPGVTVSILDLDAGRLLTLSTGDTGRFRAVALQPARYDVTASLSGFRTVKREIVLSVGADVMLHIILAVGRLDETVTVVGSAATVDVAKSHLRSTIVADEVESLPVLERNVLALAQLLPGSGPDNSLAAAQRFAVSKFGGASEQRGSFTTLVDGGSADDPVFGSPTLNVSQDAVQEFAVFRNQFDAQYGGAGSAVVTIVTKSGTNQLDGSASYFGRDRRLNARNAFARSKPAFDQQRTGFTVGGPLRANRTHLFGAYEFNNVDTARIISLPATNPFADRENGTYPAGSDNHNGLLKLTHQFSPAQALSIRYLHDRQKSVRTLVVTSDSNQADELNRTTSLVGEHRWTVSGTLVNTLRAHVRAHTIDTIPYSDEVGIVRPSVTTGRHFRHPQLFPQTVLAASDTLYMTAGAHNVKLGGDFTWSRNEFQSHLYEKGQFQFQTDAPFNPNDSRTWPVAFTQQIPGAYRHTARELAAYVQDDWLVGSHLRLNAGVRYDLDLDHRQPAFYRQLLADPRFAGLEQFVSPDRGRDLNNLQPRLGATWDVRGSGNLVLRGGWGLYTSRNRPWFQLRTMDQLLGSAVRIDDPAALGAFPDVQAVLGGRTLEEFIAAGGPRDVGLLADSIVLPYANTTSAGLGWQIGASTALEVDYIRSRGRHEYGATDYNLPPSGSIGATNPRPMSRFARILIQENYTQSQYDALQAQFRRSGSRLKVQASYTLARSLLDGVEVYFFQRGTERTPNERGTSPNEQRHNLTMAGTIELPWQVQFSGIVKLISGSAFRVQAGADLDGDRSLQNDRPAGLPITVGRGDVDTELQIINQFRATRFLPPVDRALLDLDVFRSVDVRLSKRLPLADGHVELLIEGFNLTNHVNPEPFTVNSNMVSPSVFSRMSARDARQVQWGVRYTF